MNTKRILNWGIFIVVMGLIVWGLVAASQKAKKESALLPTSDKITSEDWSRGNASSSVSLVEYSDFQCPACAAFYPLVEEVSTKLGGQFHFAYRHFPLTQHRNAIPAAQATEAAGRQGKFWEMYSEVFSQQEKWATSTNAKAHFDGYAKKIGLDMEKFNADYDLPEIKVKIEDSIKSGIKAGVNATPSFFLNGKKVNPQSYEQFKKLIEEAATSTTNS
jgi:protein-disulfide isomerase